VPLQDLAPALLRQRKALTVRRPHHYIVVDNEDRRRQAVEERLERYAHLDDEAVPAAAADGVGEPAVGMPAASGPISLPHQLQRRFMGPFPGERARQALSCATDVT